MVYEQGQKQLCLNKMLYHVLINNGLLNNGLGTYNTHITDKPTLITALHAMQTKFVSSMIQSGLKQIPLDPGSYNYTQGKYSEHKSEVDFFPPYCIRQSFCETVLCKIVSFN